MGKRFKEDVNGNRKYGMRKMIEENKTGIGNMVQWTTALWDRIGKIDLFDQNQSSSKSAETN